MNLIWLLQAVRNDPHVLHDFALLFLAIFFIQLVLNSNVLRRFPLKFEGSNAPLVGLVFLMPAAAVCEATGIWIIAGDDLGAILACAATDGVVRLELRTLPPLDSLRTKCLSFISRKATSLMSLPSGDDSIFSTLLCSPWLGISCMKGS